MIRLALLIVIAAVACGPGVKGGPTMNNKMGGGGIEKPPSSAVVSAEILARDPLANTVEVKHILIGWKTAGRDGKPSDKRAMEREKPDAEALVKSVLEQLKGGKTFDEMMKSHSEDPGSASGAKPYAVKHDDMNFDSDFRMLSIRLNTDEYGVVESQFGFHIIKRIQ